MSLAPLLNAPAVVQVHAAAAFLALALGLTVLALRKGTPIHRRLGTAWASIMLAVALTSFAITAVNPGHFSAIHILSVVTLIAIPRAVWARRNGNIRGHAIGLVSTFLGLLIAGAFTFGPGRIMHAVAFGG